MIDHAAGRLLRVTPPTSPYVIQHVRIPMRDGVELRAKHFQPQINRPAGTILVRCPYGRSFPFSFFYARLYAARGYHVVLQSVRGTFGSGGSFVPMIHEADDAADTVEWLREQPWFTGSFATIGLSYLGFTQWALLQNPPSELAAAVVTVGPHDFHASAWGTGAFSLNDFLGWSDMVGHQELSAHRRLWFQIRSTSRRNRGSRGLPLGAAGRELLGTMAPWYESWVEHPEVDHPFWDSVSAKSALDRVETPVLLLSGWQDLFLQQTIAQYQHLRRRGVDVAMTIGPWTHIQMMSKAARTTARETLAFLDAHLAGKNQPAAHRPSHPVRVFLGGHGWLDLPDWPPATGEGVLYLQPNGRLAANTPPVEAQSSSFVYDPADPTPSIGGRLLSFDAGYRDDGKLAERADVLAFTSGPLDADLYVTGKPVIELRHHSDNPHFDVFVRLSEVDAQGRSRNVSDGFQRFTENPDGPIRLELDPIAHRFRTGTRLRVLIAGGAHPRFARNLGTGEPPITGHRMALSTHTVHHGAGGLSKLLLPASAEPPSSDGIGHTSGNPQ
jgi:putative CocE/NonD family hydrolase